MAYIIAEIGVNHDGNTDKALRLIDASGDADAVKFQVFDCEKLEPPGERREMLRRLQLTSTEIGVVRAHAASRGLEFIATPFDMESLEFLLGIGLKTIKIGSGELRYRKLIERACSAKRVLVSTGMSSIWDVEKALNGLPVIPMHCVSSYPCPIEDANLLAVRLLRGRWGEVGFSDHTLSTVLPSAAVALGTGYIEKHITLNRGDYGPDHASSLEPHEFAEMVKNCREVEAALGDGIKRIMSSEERVSEIRKEREEWRAR